MNKNSSSILAILIFLLAALQLPVVGQVNKYTGGATYSVPLPSVGGIAPSIQYGSNVRELVYGMNKNIQSGWIGLNWSLQLGSIMTEINNTADSTDDTYFYVGADGGSTLVYYSGNEFRMKEYKYWKIFRTIDQNGKIIGWTITKEDGIVYKYGNIDTSSSSSPFTLSYSPTYATRMKIGFGFLISSPLDNYYDSAKYIPYQWDLSEIKFLNDTKSRIIYQQDQSRLSSGNKRTPIYYTRESHPKFVIDRTGRHLKFDLTSRSSSEYFIPSDSLEQPLYEKKYLSKITLRTSDSSLIQQIDFGYDTAKVSGSTQLKRYLTSISFKDAKGVALPSTRFKYVGIGGESNGPNIGALKSVVSSVGGGIEFTYNFQKIPTQLSMTTSYSGADAYISDTAKLASSGIVGSDYYIVPTGTTSSFKVYRWGSKGWFHDDNFPNVGNYLSYSVAGNYIVFMCTTTLMKIVKRKEDSWETFNISSMIAPANSKIRLLGIGNNYFVIGNNVHKDIPTARYVEDVHILKYYDGKWDTNYVATYEYSTTIDTIPINVYCGPNYFVVNYSDSGYDLWIIEYDRLRNASSGLMYHPSSSVYTTSYTQKISSYWVWTSLSPSYTGYYRTTETWNANYDITGVATASPNLLAKDYFMSSGEAYLQKWNGDNFSGEIAVPGSSHFDNLYTSDLYFVLQNNSTYKINHWTGDSLNPILIDTLNRKFYATNIPLTNAKLGVGSDNIIVGWDDNGVGKLGITYYKNGQWQAGAIIDQMSGKKVTPYFVGDDIVAVWEDSPLTTHIVKTYKHINDIWTSAGDIRTETGFTTGKLTFSRSNGNIFVDLVKKSSTGTDISLYAHVKSLGTDTNVVYTDSIGTYVVQTIRTWDGMGNNYTTKYLYEQGSSTDGTNVQFNRVTEYPAGNIGKTETYFYNDRNTADSAYDFVDVYNYKNLDGASYRTKSYNSIGTLIAESKTIWDYHWIDSTVGISQRRVLSTESTLDGVKTIRKFEYNNSNGLVSKTTDSLFNVKTDRGSNQNIVTEIKYAFESHATGMNSSGKNMLVYPFETKVSEKDANDTLTLRSHKRSFYAPNPPYYVTSSRVLDSTRWIITDSVITRDTLGNIVESKNIDGVLTTAKWGFNKQVPYASIVNATNLQTFVEQCEEYTTSSYGPLALGFVSFNSTASAITYSTSKNGIGGSAQKIAIPASSSGGMAGVLLNLGALPPMSYFIEFDYLVTQGVLSVYTISGTGGTGTQFVDTAKALKKWKHGKVLWTFTTTPSNARLYFRLNNSVSNVPATTFYLDNVRIYPANAFCNSLSYDPVTLRLNSTTNENGVSSVSTYDGFGRTTHIKR